MIYWASSFLTYQADYDLFSYGAIDLSETESFTLENNYKSSAEPYALFYKGDVYTDRGELLNKNLTHSIKNNTIYSSLISVTMLPTHFYPNLTCVRVSGFTIVKSAKIEIYVQTPHTLHADNKSLIENQMGIYGMIIEPRIAGHEMSNKIYNVSDSLIIDQSSSFNCTCDSLHLTLNYNKSTLINSYGVGLNRRGKLGMVWSNFLSGTNQAPKKTWTNIKTFKALDGLTQVENVTFAHFNLQPSSCGFNRDYVISNSLNNDDGQHPVVFKNVYLNNVEHAS